MNVNPISFDNLVYSLQSDWLGFAVVFAIVFSVAYIGISRFFIKGGRIVQENVGNGRTRNVREKKHIDNKPFVIIIAACIALLVSASVMQMGTLRIKDSGYGIIASMGVVLVVIIILTIPFYKFLDMNINSRVITNLLSFTFIWIVTFMMRFQGIKLGNLPGTWLNVLNFFGNERFLLVGLIGAIILGLIFKKR